MKKKLLALLMAAALCMGMLPTTVLADMEESPDAQTEDVTYREEADGVIVEVTAPDDALPEDAELSVQCYDEDSKDYQSAAKAIDYEEAGEYGMAALDISFLSDGKEVEPTEAVQVSIDLSGILPEDADASTLEVQHLQKRWFGRTKAVVVADDSESTEGTIDEENATAEFEVKSFSTFTVTWKWSDTDSTSLTMTVYLDGNDISDYWREDGITFTSEDHELNLEDFLYENDYGTGDYTFLYATVTATQSTGGGGPTGGGTTEVNLGSESNPVVAISKTAGPNTTFEVTLLDGTTYSSLSNVTIIAYYATPEFSVDISAVGADAEEDWLLQTTLSHAGEYDHAEYVWTVTSVDEYGNDTGNISNAASAEDYGAGRALITWSDDVEDDHTVMVHVTVNLYDENNNVIGTATASYELEYSDETIDIDVTYGPDGTSVGAGVTVTIVNTADAQYTYTGTTNSSGRVEFTGVHPGTYTVTTSDYTDASGNTYACDSNETLALHEPGNYDINLKYQISDEEKTYLPEKSDWNHIDIKLSVGSSSTADANSVISFDIDSVQIIASGGTVKYTSGYIEKENDVEFQIYFNEGKDDSGSGGSHTINFDSTDTIVIVYTETWTDSNGNVQTQEFTIEIDASTTYAAGTTYPADGARAYKLYNYLYGTSYSSDAELMAAGVTSIDISGLGLMTVAAILCDSSVVDGAGSLDGTGDMWGMDFALSLEAMASLGTSWSFDIEKILENISMDAGTFGFFLYDATVSSVEGDEGGTESENVWTIEDTVGDYEQGFTNAEQGKDLDGNSKDTMQSSTIAYTDDEITSGEPIYYILYEYKGGTTDEYKDGVLSYDGTVYGVKIDFKIDGDEVSVVPTYYLLTYDSDLKGYVVSSVAEVTTNSEGEPVFQFVNTYTTDVTISKTDEDGKAVAAQFTLTQVVTDPDGNKRTCYYDPLNESGPWVDYDPDDTETTIPSFTLGNVELDTPYDGTYTLTETESANGYGTIPSAISFDVADGVIVVDSVRWADDSITLDIKDYITLTENYLLLKLMDPKDPTKDVDTDGDGEYGDNGKKVQVGDTLTYEIDYANPYSDAATVTITDVLDKGLTYVSSEPEAEVSTNDDGKTVLTWTIENVEAYGENSVTFTATVNENARVLNVVDNTATVQVGDHPSQHTNTVDNPLEPTKGVDTDGDGEYDDAGEEVQVGDELTYQITYYNVTNEVATVTVTDVLDQGLTYVSSDPEAEVSTNDDGQTVLTWIFKDVAAYKGGTVTYTATVNENAVVQGEVENTASMQIGDNLAVESNTVTNPVSGKITISGEKAWDDADDQDGIRPDYIDVYLLADGEYVSDGYGNYIMAHVTPDADGNWTFHFDDLTKYGEDGLEIEYSVLEVAVTGYDTTYSELTEVKDPDTDEGSGEYTVTITNSHTPETIDINGSKTWDDADNQDGKRPESITIHLFADGEEIASKTVTATGNNNLMPESPLFLDDTDDGWSWSFTDLPKYKVVDGEGGVEIVYTITEDVVEGYTTEVNGYDVINSYTPETIDIEGEKTWDDADDQDGVRPDYIIVHLLADGVEIKRQIVIEEDGTWSWSFSDLPKYRDGGTEIIYTVTEDAVEGYETTISELTEVTDPDTGEGTGVYTITIENTYEPETINIEGEKAWEDNEDQDHKRPESVTINLMADGEAVLDDEGNAITATVTAADDWAFSFTDLPKYSEGKEIQYTITEDAVDDYTADIEITKDEDGNYTVVVSNSYTPAQTSLSVSKVWNDANDQDGIRPQSITVKLLADGVDTGKTLVLSDSNNWQGSFEGLDIYADGTEIEYTIEEVSVKGYTSVITGDAENGYSITNTHEPETVDVAGEKTWDDDDDLAGLRPESITITLLADGVEIGKKEVTEADGWTWSFTDLPKYSNGEEIVYTIDEVKITDDEGQIIYSSEIDGYDVTNSYPAAKTVTVLKEWNDRDDRAGVRPESIEVQLLQNGEPYTDSEGNDQSTVILDESNDWTYTFEDLPFYLDGTECEYTVEEITELPDGYESAISTEENGEGTYVVTITNTYMAIDLEGTKVWDDADDQDGIRPDYITIYLYANGEQVYDENGNPVTATIYNHVEPAKLNAGAAVSPLTAFLSASLDHWNWVFTNLPKYDEDGNEIEYTVVEERVDGYAEPTYSVDEDGNIVITNTHEPEKINLSGTKVWDDNDDQDGIRPTYVDVYLTIDGERVSDGYGGYISTTASADDWTWSFTGLDKYADGKEIHYGVEEEIAVDGYESTITGDAESGYTITNKHEPETLAISFAKVWDDNDNQDGKEPGSITVHILADGEDIGHMTVNGEDDWSGTFTDLPKYKLVDEKGGVEIVYTLTEDAVDDYSTEYGGLTMDADGNYSFTITNTYTPEQTSLTVTKVWDDANDQDGKRPDDITVTLVKNGVATEQTLTLSEENGWFGSFTGLDEYENGEKIEYTVQEGSLPDGYTATITGDATTGYVITNSYTPETTRISGEKVWDDDDDHDGLRHEVITVRLLADGVPIDYKEITANEDWSWSFDDLPKYRDGGIEIIYTVTEDALENYTPYIEDHRDGTFTITNTHTLDKTSLTVTKAWDDSDDHDGLRPESITVNLFANGEPALDEYGDPISATIYPDENGNWTYTFTDLDMYTDEGEKIIYTVEEESIDGYTSVREGNMTSGYTFTNTHELETVDIEGSKIWNDKDNQDGLRPEYILVYLLADGEEVSNGYGGYITVVANAESGWNWSFTDLPKYNDEGKEIVYSVVEEAVGEYDTEITGDAESGFTITNTHIPESAPEKDVDADANGKYGDSGMQVQVGDELTYKIDYENPYDEAATVTITDVLDIGLDFVSADNGGTYDEETRTITWVLEDVEADTAGSVTFTATVNEDSLVKNEVDNTATVQVGDHPEKETNTVYNPVPGKDVDADGDGIYGDSGIGVQVGGTVTYVIYYFNGNDEAATVKITDALADGLDFVSADYGGTYHTITNTITWEIENVAPHTGGYVTFKATVNEDALEYNEVENTATVQIGHDSVDTNTVYNPVPDKDVDADGDGKYGDSGVQVQVGDTLTYKIDYQNSDDTAATVTITDVLDIGLDFVSASDGGTYDEETRTITWVLEDVAPHSEDGYYVTFTATVNEDALEKHEVDNTATVQVGDHPAQDTNTVYNPVPEKDVDADGDGLYGDSGLGVQVGDTVTYEIYYFNGNDEAATITITDALDKGLDFVSASDNGTYTERNSTITWVIEEVAPHTGGSVTFTATVNETALEKNEVDNTASVQINNEKAVDTNTVYNPVSDKDVDADGDGKYGDSSMEVQVGDELTYKISYQNSDDETATVTITDVLDIGLDFVSASDGGTYDKETRTITWILEDVAPHSEDGYYVTFTATVNEDALEKNEVVNTASVQVGDHPAQDTNTVDNPVPERIDISGTKTWVEEDGDTSDRPKSITVYLLANGVPAVDDEGNLISTTVTPDDDGNWTYTFTDLPKEKDGKEITYTVYEEMLENYTPTYDGYDIINTHTPGKIAVTVNKYWEDEDNWDGIRPEYVTVELYKNGERTYTIVELNEENNWQATFSDLALYEDGELVDYTVKELDAPDGYTSKLYPADPGDGEGHHYVFAFVNEHNIDTTDVEVQKFWDDNDDQDGLRPESIDVTLTGTYTDEDGNETECYFETKTLDESTDWTAEFYQLPINQPEGNKVTYTVEEVDAIDGYETEQGEMKQLDDGSYLVKITNTHTPDTVDIKGSKIWDDNDDQDGKRPASITIRLWGDGAIVETKTVTADADGNWTWSFTDLPKYDNGVEITYNVTEDIVPEYSTTYDGYDVINSYTPGKTSVTVTKAWDDAGDQDGIRPESIEVTLVQNGTATGQTLTLDESNNWIGSFTDLDVYTDGRENVYTVQEETVDGYTTETTGDAETGYVITNTRKPETVDIEGEKIWDDNDDQDGIRPTEILVDLYADGMQVPDGNGGYIDAVVTAESNWTWSFSDLPRYRDGGTEIEYTVKEHAVDGYTSEVGEVVEQDDGSYTVTITNTHEPETIDIEGAKTWDDKDNQDGTRPDHITVHLWANGVPALDENGEEIVLTVTEADGWSWSITDLPKYKNGEEITYFLFEDPVEDYTATYDGYNITNTHTPGETGVTVNKHWEDEGNWDGIRPAHITVELLKNGEATGIYLVLSDENNWQTTFTGLDLYEDGERIDYSVREVDVPDGYVSTLDPSDEATEEGYHYVYTFVNEHNIDTTDVTVKKFWDDENDQDGLRPESIEVTLTGTYEEKDGTETVCYTKTETADASTDWTAEFHQLPINWPEGNEVTYTVAEVEVPDGYESTQGKLTQQDDGSYLVEITNTHEPETIDIEGEKTWDDNDDQDGARPDYITIQLWAGGELVESRYVTAQEGWSWSFTDLPKYKDGEEITYRIVEDALDDYSTTYDGYNVTNTHTPGKTSVTVSKVWDDTNDQDGIRPSAITVELVKNGDATGQEVILNEDNNWRDSFTNLDVYTDGVKNDYTVKETDLPDGYTSVTTGDALEGYVITNTYEPETVNIAGEKTWDDNNNQDGLRPDSIVVYLLADGQRIPDGYGGYICEEVSPDAHGAWNWDFTDLPKYDGKEADGSAHEIVYSLEEVEIEGYDSTVEGFDITNTHVPETIDITGEKIWDDNNDQDSKRPTEVTIRLWADSTLADSVTLDGDPDWKWSFSDLPKYKDGEEITYHISEDALSGYTPEITQNDDGSYTITNSYTPGKTSLTVKKAWDDANDQDGKRPESIEVKLMADDIETGLTLMLEESNGWSGTFTDLDEYAGGEKIEYTVEESDVPEGYTSVVDGDALTGYVITNSYTPETTAISGIKTWDDNDDQDGKRPGYITVNLYADGVKIDSIHVTAEEDWAWSFDDLPKYEYGGHEINYAVLESALDDYTPTYMQDDDGNYEIINTYAPGKTSVSVTKNWDDEYNQDNTRPEEITVELIKNGTRTGETLTLDEANGWRGIFDDLDVYTNGRENVYTVWEEAVDGYTSVITGDAETGYYITNSYEPALVDITGTKTWDDNNDQDGKRPAYITIHLFADGEEIDYRNITAKENWSWSFAGLQKYRDGKEITYTITEDAVDGYTTTIDGYDVTNSYTPETTEVTGTKTWEDDDDNDHERPDSITVYLLADGVPVSDGNGGVLSATVTGDDWTYTFTDLPKYKDGKEITYTVLEGMVEGYTPTYDGNDITNIHTPDEIAVTVNKYWEDEDDWDGIRPDNITVELLKNGEGTGTYLVLNDENDWQAIFTGLALYENGELVDYSVRELNAPDGYTSKLYPADLGDEEGHHYVYAFVNEHNIDTTDVEVHKFWDDNNDQDGLRPESIDVTLTGTYTDGDVETECYTETKTIDASSDWTAEFYELPVNQPEGNEVTYTVAEVNVPDGYESEQGEMTKLDDGSYLVEITNTYTPETVTIAGEKTWDDKDDQDGKRPDHITITLWADNEMVDTIEVSEREGWRWSFTDLPKYKDGVEITYHIHEVAVDDYSTTYDGYDITNSYTPEQTSVTVTKVWNDQDDQDGVRPESIDVELLADGDPVMTGWGPFAHALTVTLDESNNWQDSFTELDKYADGQEIVYTVQEVLDDETAEAYETVTTGDAATGYVITNTYQSEMITIYGEKVWDDENDQDGLRPDYIVVHLFADGVEIDKETITYEEDNWQFAFTGLPQYADGKEIEYTVKETLPSSVSADAYTSDITEEDGVFTITNTHTPETVDLEGTKVWDDADNQDGVRPDHITIHLLADGVEVDSLTLPDGGADDGANFLSPDSPLYFDTDTNVWNWSFTDLPKYKDGVEITYTVTEDAVAGYETTYSADGLTITNTHIPETIEIPVEKLWEDDGTYNYRPTAVEVELLADGAETGRMLTLSSRNDWTDTFTNLAKYRDNGEEIDYTVKEITPEALQYYTPKTTYNDDGSVTIMNQREYFDIDEEIVPDEDDRDSWVKNEAVNEYNAIEIEMSTYLPVIETDELANGQFTMNFHDVLDSELVLDEADADFAVAIAGYRISPEYYTVEIDPDDGCSFHVDVDLTALYNDGIITEEDLQGDTEIMVFFYADLEGTNLNGTYKSTVWYEVYDGDELEYTSSVDVVEVYTYEIYITKYDEWTGEALAGATFGVYYDPACEFAVTRNGEEYTAVSGVDGAAIFFGLADGTYYVKELEPPEGYVLSDEVLEVVLNEDLNDSNHMYVGEYGNIPMLTEVSGTKIWDDNDNEAGMRPDSITVRLWADGAEAGSMTVTEADGWSWNFTDLLKYENGTEISYTVTEDAVENYSPTYVADSYDIVNSFTQGSDATTSVTVVKEWDDENDRDGSRPESITVSLLANGEETGNSLVLDQSNNWRGTFGALDEYENGERIEYSVTESAVDGYESVITGSAAEGYVITNTHTPETEDVVTITGSKAWDDNGNEAGARPESITVRLLADGEEVGSRTVTAADGWSWSFTDLPRYKDGSEISYILTEDATNGYGTEYNGYSVTNHYTGSDTTSVTVVKAWDDGNNADGIRPDSITVELLANGEKTGNTLVLGDANLWMGSFAELDTTDADGDAITYTVSEVSVDGYASTTTGSAASGYVITNTHEPVSTKVTEVSGSKTWDDNDNEAGKRPESITVRLLADGEEVDKRTVTAENDWSWSFTDLPMYDGETEIHYAVTEDAVENYTPIYTGYDITNRYTPSDVSSSKTNVTVVKAWDDSNDKDGIRPESITVHLLKDGTETGQTLVLDASNNWTGSFNELDEYTDGVENVYTVQEVSVEGYTSVIAGSAETAYVITNTHVSEKSNSGNDGNNGNNGNNGNDGNNGNNGNDGNNGNNGNSGTSSGNSGNGGTSSGNSGTSGTGSSGTSYGNSGTGSTGSSGTSYGNSGSSGTSGTSYGNSSGSGSSSAGNAKTGDTNWLYLWIILIIAAAAAVVSVVTVRTRRQRARK